MATPLVALQAVAALAGIVAGLKTIFDGAHERLEEKLHQVLVLLQDLQATLASGLVEILEAIDGIRRQIDEDVSLDAMVLADRAIYSDLVIFNDKQAAFGNSFSAAQRIFRELDVAFAGALMYVGSIRLAVLKDYDPQFALQKQLYDEFSAYVDKLNDWAVQLDSAIRAQHSFRVSKVLEVVTDDSRHVDFIDGPEPNRMGLTVSVSARGQIVKRQSQQRLEYWLGEHLKDGDSVHSFSGPDNDLSEKVRERVESQAKNAMKSAIREERVQFGVVAMEQTVLAWRGALNQALHLAIVTQFFGRRSVPSDFRQSGILVDGSIIPTSGGLRAALLPMLLSREFSARAIKSSSKSDPQQAIAEQAFKSLFGREPTDTEAAVLQRTSKEFGLSSAVASLLNSELFNEHYVGKRHGQERSPS